MNLKASGIEKRRYSCYRDGLKINGTLFLPQTHKNERLPIAIVCHEFMANQLFSFSYAKALAGIGFAAFCFDFCGGGLVSMSRGSRRDMSVLTEISDLKAVIRFAQSLSNTDESNLLLVGCSQGGLVAALTAAQMPETVNGLVLLYPALCIPDAARAGKMLWLKFDPSHIPEKMHAGPMPLGRRYAADVMNMDAFQQIAGYSGKVLLLHGDRDTIVSISNTQKACCVYQSAGANVRFVTIPGGKHIFRKPSQIRQATQEIIAFAHNIIKKEHEKKADNGTENVSIVSNPKRAYSVKIL